jgi:5-hydroxyisourate hydrolase
VKNNVGRRKRLPANNMARISTHVLDTARGRPAAGVGVSLQSLGRTVAQATTNPDGRAVLMDAESIPAGVYELIFGLGRYFRAGGEMVPEPPFLAEVVVRFGVADPAANYHVPLLVSPYGYSTYRGS